MHCAQCLAEKPEWISAAEYARLAVGPTSYGVQVWCLRHNMNVYHLDLTRLPRPGMVTHGRATETPYSADLRLSCYRCGFDPQSGEEP
jgi:hypothetical protein